MKNLFHKPQIIQNKRVKYSTLIVKFMEPFADEFADIAYYEDIFEFVINAWNIGNIKLIFSESGSKALINAIEAQDQGTNTDLLKRMIDYKISHFKEYTHFITDFEIEKISGGPVLSVIVQEQDVYLATMAKTLEEQNEDSIQDES